MRLDRYLANHTALSRKQARAHLRAGRVRVDGAVATDGASALDSACTVTLDGVEVQASHRLIIPGLEAERHLVVLRRTINKQ